MCKWKISHEKQKLTNILTILSDYLLWSFNHNFMVSYLLRQRSVSKTIRYPHRYNSDAVVVCLNNFFSLHSVRFPFESIAKHDKTVFFKLSIFKVKQTIVNEIVYFLFLKQVFVQSDIMNLISFFKTKLVTF